jgi:hypothetical protein
MGVEMNEPDRAVADQTAENRQGDQVIAADGQRHGRAPANVREMRLDRSQAVFDAERVDRCIAAIADPQDIEWRHPRHVMDASDEARLIANLAWTMARPCPVRGAAVEGNADKRNIHLLRLRKGQPHEAAGAGEARNDS